MSDERLARLAGRGDGAAFAELARRYRPLITAATRGLPNGLDVEDARQAALLGLWEACRVTDGVRCFAGLAAKQVRWKVINARKAATTRRQRVLTDALRDGAEDGRDGVLAGVPAPEATDPARVVELHERLRERALIARPRVIGPNRDGRRFTDAQVTRALGLIAGGATLSEAAATVGATPHHVKRWLDAPVKPARQAARTERVAAGEQRADVIELAAHRSSKTRVGSGLPDAGLKGAA